MLNCKTARAMSFSCVLALLWTAGATSPHPAALASLPQAHAAERDTATFAAGCFWSMEAIFKQLRGVDRVLPGYAGGTAPNPTYDLVETGRTGYAETVNVTFDPAVIRYRDLLKVLLTCRNPTTPNRQGNDEGPQYRFIIFYHSEQQRQDAQAMIRKVAGEGIWPGRFAVEVAPFQKFYRAEDYHLDYYHRHPNQGYCAGVIAPEIAEFRSKFHGWLKQ